MSPAGVRAQLREVYLRLIESSLSVQQNYPQDLTAGDLVRIGDLRSTAFGLKNVSYQTIYRELESNSAFHIKLPDGGLLIFQYSFVNNVLTAHRLAFFPSPELPTMEEAPHLYQNDELFADILVDRIVRFPIRFDFNPSQHRDVDHPKSHLTLGQFDNCRIPVNAAVSPNTFVTFVLRNFYAMAYRRNLNRFRKHVTGERVQRTITVLEQRIPHVVVG